MTFPRLVGNDEEAVSDVTVSDGATRSRHLFFPDSQRPNLETSRVSRLISAESSAQSQMPDGVKVLEEREFLA
jgi:hypothetical protein